VFKESSLTPTENNGASGDELAMITLQQPESIQEALIMER